MPFRGSLLWKIGELDSLAEKTHVPVKFYVPDGLEQLEVRFSYAPVQPQPGLPMNELSLSLFDPQGCRGTRHNNRQLNVLLSNDAATPGHVARPLQGGEWCAVIDVHRLLAGCQVNYTLEVVGHSAGDGGAATLPVPQWAAVPEHAPRRRVSPSPNRNATANLAASPALNPTTNRANTLVAAPRFNRPRPPATKPRWFRGDIHTHSLHSDATWDVPDLVAAARTEGLDCW